MELSFGKLIQLFLNLSQQFGEIGQTFTLLIHHRSRSAGRELLVAELSVGLGDFAFQASSFFAETFTFGGDINLDSAYSLQR